MRIINKKKVGLFLLVVITVACMIKPTYAASASSKIDLLIKTMNNYEKVILYELDMSGKKQQSIKLTDREKAFAATVSLNTEKLKGVRKDEFGNFDTYVITSTSVKNASKKMFGSRVSSGKLKKQRKENRYPFDAYRYGRQVRLFANMMENEAATNLVRQTITRKGSGYIVKRWIYRGYWGHYNGTANKLITYSVKKSAGCRYGFVFCGVTVKQL